MVKRIILHWSAGTYIPTNFEKQHYHYLIDDKGKIYSGIYKPEDNDDCTDGKYAQHTGGGNTNSLGVCLCGMKGFKSSVNCGQYPITKIQLESCMQFVATQCIKYNIVIAPNTVLTHYEFGKNHENTASFGKIDIIWLPPYPFVIQSEVGAFIRSKVRWYKEKICNK